MEFVRGVHQRNGGGTVDGSSYCVVKAAVRDARVECRGDRIQKRNVVELFKTVDN